ncbi:MULTISPECIES: GtrA family protein [unclassified Rhizobium]|nr:GtrA family protein [Rhizobium sp. 16-488-2b]MBO9173695.1 GtrA family protein [Rhizobium sp. 16-488-2a]
MLRNVAEVRQDVVRFIVAGIVNTAFTTGIYFSCLTITAPSVAYAIAWACGMAFVFFVYPDKVFRGGSNALSDRIKLVLSNILVFVVGWLLLTFLLRAIGGSILPYCITVGITTLCNFAMGRLITRS